MIADAALALRRAIHARLISDAPLVSRLGGQSIYDAPPRNASMPYVAYGPVRSRDWSTATETGAEHSIEIEIWSEYHGAQEAIEIAALVVQSLASASLQPDGQELVLLRCNTIDTRREKAGRFVVARLTFRALTEAA